LTVGKLGKIENLIVTKTIM